jgi:hypothetical protein
VFHGGGFFEAGTHGNGLALFVIIANLLAQDYPFSFASQRPRGNPMKVRVDSGLWRADDKKKGQ